MTQKKRITSKKPRITAVKKKHSTRTILAAIIVVFCMLGVAACFVLAAFDKTVPESLGNTLALGGPLAFVALVFGKVADHHSANVNRVQMIDEKDIYG